MLQALVLAGLLAAASCTLSAYTGSEPASALSDVYRVTLAQRHQKLQPTTYISRSPDDSLQQIHGGIFCSLHGRWFCNRTVSWAPYGDDGEAGVAPVRVTVRLLRFPAMSFLPPTGAAAAAAAADDDDDDDADDDAQAWQAPHVLPRRAGIGTVRVSADGAEATFLVPPAAPRHDDGDGDDHDEDAPPPRHLALAWGARVAAEAGLQGASGSFAHALYVFAGAPDPPPPSAAALANGSALFFGPGAHRIGGGGGGGGGEPSEGEGKGDDGILQLPAAVERIHLARGAWVEGRINVSAAERGSAPLRVVGHGVMSGARYTWHGGGVGDSLRFLEPAWRAPLHLDGPTFVDAKGHALILPPNSSAVGIAVLGWLYNEDGVWLTSHSSLRRSFVRTNDDSVRVYAGAIDGFANAPPAPPRDGVPAAHVEVADVVVHQLFNGAVLQLGWESFGCVDSAFRRLDVVGAEWYWVANRSNATAGDSGNDAVLSLQSPQYDLGMLEHHRNVSVRDVRCDVPVGRFVALDLRGAAPPPGNCSSVEGVHVADVALAQGLQWFATDLGVRQPGENLLCALRCDSMRNIVFRNTTLLGRHVRADADWNLDRVGNVVGVKYE